MVSRSFALSIEALPARLVDAVRVSYLLCRLVDTIEDATRISSVQRESLFDRFGAVIKDDDLPAEALEQLFQRVCSKLGVMAQAEFELGSSSGAIIRVFRSLDMAQVEVIRPVVLEMARGMREYSSRELTPWSVGITNFQDLERYCYYVAGVVGQLLTQLFLQVVQVPDRVRSDLDPRAVNFGIGLQLVNITKDAAEDFQRGICFLPGDMACQHGLARDRLLDPDQRRAGLQVIRQITARAREHLSRAMEYTALWPVPDGAMIRMFCIVPLALAYATLEAIERDVDTLRPGKNPAVSRVTVLRIFQEAQRAALSHHAFEQMFPSLVKSPNTSLPNFPKRVDTG